MKEIRKPWGKELWIAQEKEYGGKILIIKGNRHTSQHFHKDKKETIYCFKGEVEIVLNDGVVTLKEGEDVTLIPRSVHRIVGKKDSVLFEVSTPQLADVVRLKEE
ncbi:MAG: cupin domain-containing protein [Candidatus Bathyarchaeota archaeon]|nr:MAG: cupin domain-containing protein [Candidatus Bathyarchaeota archaeon]